MSQPLNVSDLSHRELQSSKTGEKYSLSVILNDLIGFKDVFIHHEIILPGRRSSGSHSHTHREEMVYVLEGSPTARLKGQDYPMKPGDFIGFQPGPENFHFLKNETTSPAHVLIIASNPPQDQVIYDG